MNLTTFLLIWLLCSLITSLLVIKAIKIDFNIKLSDFDIEKVAYIIIFSIPFPIGIFIYCTAIYDKYKKEINDFFLKERKFSLNFTIELILWLIIIIIFVYILQIIEII